MSNIILSDEQKRAMEAACKEVLDLAFDQEAMDKVESQYPELARWMHTLFGEYILETGKPLGSNLTGKQLLFVLEAFQATMPPNEAVRGLLELETAGEPIDK